MDSLVSVVIPCYQQGRYLADAIASLKAQTYENWEAIIVDDGSTDETPYVAYELARTDSRVNIVSKENGGLSSARNVGLERARGQWVQFLDADDLLMPDKFKAHLSMTRRCTESTITYTNYFHGDELTPMRRIEAERVSHEFRLERPVLDFASRWEHDFSIPIHTPLFPAWPFQSKMIRFDESLDNHEDWDMWMQVMACLKKVVFIPFELAVYRVRRNSMSRNRQLMWRGYNAAIRKQMTKFAGDADVQRSLKYLMAMNNYLNYRGLRGSVHKVCRSKVLAQVPLVGRAASCVLQPKCPSLGRSNC